MPNELVEAKMLLLHATTLMADLIEASYLRENGEMNRNGSSLQSKLQKIKSTYSTLKTETDRQSLVKRFFDYSVPFEELSRIIDDLSTRTGWIDCKRYRQTLRELHRAISDKERITLH